MSLVLSSWNWAARTCSPEFPDAKATVRGAIGTSRATGMGGDGKFGPKKEKTHARPRKERHPCQLAVLGA